MPVARNSALTIFLRMGDAPVSTAAWTRGSKTFVSLLALVVAARIAMVLFLPFGQKVEHHLEGLNDEPAHFNYVKFLAQHRAFPVLEHWVTEPDAFVRNEFEYHQAPLYYLACTPLYLMFSERNALWACRLLSTLCGIATLFVIVLFLRDCGCSAPVQQAGALFAGLLFSHLYFTSVVSNDGMSWLIALLLTRELLRYGTAGLGRSRTASVAPAVSMTLLLAAGALTKGSLLIFFPVVAGVVFYKYYISKDRSHLVRGIAVLGISAAAVAPWYARNLTMYHSLLGTPPAPAWDFCTLHGAAGLVKATIKYFWFPMQHLHGGTPAFFLLVACGGALLCGHLILATRWVARKEHRTFVTAFSATVLLLNAAAYVWYFVQWRNPEARFLFPALGPLVFFVVVPTYQFFSRFNIERLFLPYVLALALFSYPFLFFAG
jgi:hypothetical protein